MNETLNENRTLKILAATLAVCCLILAAALLVLILAVNAALIQTAAEAAEVPETEVMPYESSDQRTHMTPLPAMGAEAESLAAVIHAEARGESHTGQVAVAAVILNRAQDPRWPGTIRQVVNQPDQFAVSRTSPPADRYVEAITEVLAGEDPTNGALYFYNPETATDQWIRTRETTVDIGEHRFAR